MAEQTVSGTVAKALIVDDNWDNRNIFRIALEAVQFSVAECQNGIEGLSILSERTFDLLILDLQMPHMDGRTVLKSVRTQPLHRALRILVVTANPHMVTDEITSLADYVMYKPINVMEFSRFAERLYRKAGKSLSTDA